MHLLLGEFYHIYNRGNNRQSIFFNQNNYLFFLEKVKEQISPCADIICYCLMPNHFHFIVQANEKSIKERKSFGGKPMQEFAYRIGILLSSYSQAINKQNKTTGSLFQQKTKAKILCEEVEGKKENYLENCFFYIHSNPIKAKLVKDLTTWPYSSYLDYTEQRKGSLCNKEIFIQQTGFITTDIINRSAVDLTIEMINKFR